MHEFSIGQSIVDMVTEALAQTKPKPVRLRKTKIVVGRYHQIEPEHLGFAYGVLIQGTPAEGSVLDITPVPITALCRACGWKGPIQGTFFSCGQCGDGDIEMVSGRELYLESLEVDQEGV